MARDAMANGGAELPKRQTVERKLQHDMHEAERQQYREAKRIVVEIKRGGCGACRGNQGQSRSRNIGPADHLGFDEPVQVVIGVDKGEQADQAGIEIKVRYSE